MPKICYTKKKFNADHTLIIERANEVIANYAAQGYDLTLRQLYYQFIARDLFPETWVDEEYNAANGLGEETKNTQKNYKRLGTIISDGRRAGKIDWDAIVDRTRNVREPSAWGSPTEIVAECARQYNVDFWKDQKWRPEVWVEKDALIGVLEVACEPWRVPFFSCRGYTSDSEVWGAAQRLISHIRHGKKPIVFHLGDHDPSGIDMSRDIQDRLTLFGMNKKIEVRRIALTMEQVREVDPPPNPAKETDARFKGYQELYGDESWELDALDPAYITNLIEENMKDLIDDSAWKASEEERDESRRLLTAVAENWDDVTDGL